MVKKCCIGCFVIFFILGNCHIVLGKNHNDSVRKNQELLLMKANVRMSLLDGGETYIAFINTTLSQNNEVFGIDIVENMKSKDENGMVYIKLSEDHINRIREGIETFKSEGGRREDIKLLWFAGEEPQGKPQKFRIEDENMTDLYPEEKTPESVSPQIREVVRTGSSFAESNGDKDQSENLNKLLGEIESDFISRKSNRDYVVIIFDNELRPFYVSRNDVAVGDLIYVGVIYLDIQNIEVEFQPCSLEPEAPQLYIGEKFQFDLLQSREYKFILSPPRQCYNSSVEISVKADKQIRVLTTEGLVSTEVPIEGRYNLNQYNRYRGTLQLGILFSDLHQESFGLKKNEDKSVIFNMGPVDTGPEYTASVIIYSFLHYLEDIFLPKNHFSGRDIINDQNFIDRIGAVFGVGLTNPTRRFFMGFSLEVAYGVNLIGVWEFARLNRLGNDLSEGDEFSGTAEEIPIQEYWDNCFVFGISLDLRYITALFNRK